MKKALITILTLLNIQAFAQSLPELKAALGTNKAIQATHAYPKDIRGGNCHWVPVTSFTVSGNDIRIVETWTNGYSSTSHTTLVGKITNNVAEGTWESDYSSGTWYYNFDSKGGKWNKTASMFGSFTEMQPLFLRIVSSDAQKDGEFPCK